MLTYDNITLDQTLKAMENKGYRIFSSEPYDINMVGIRTNDPDTSKFNDIFICFYMEHGNWIFKAWKCTTDPGLYWLANPMNVDGTAILKPGQYRGGFKLGKHRNSYEALQQRIALPVYRDRSKDKVMDFDEDSVQEGYYGINIHRAGSREDGSTYNDKWSAGCQVFSVRSEFEDFITIVKQSVQKWGNKITYTLFEEDDIK